MRDYDRELAQLRERIAQRRENITVLGQLKEQERYWMQEGASRLVQWNKEQKDVERLERVSLSSVWATLRGSKEADMDREKAEEWTARLKWQEAQRQLAEIQSEIKDREARIAADDDCETRYEAVLVEKEQAYRKKDPVLAAKLADIERREMPLAVRCKELREAVDAGERAMSQIATALEKLDAADSWSTWDILGGGLLADVMKYNNLDEAQRLIEQVQSDLRRYQAELADVAQMAQFKLQYSDMLHVADVFFDSFFADWMVSDRIAEAASQLRTVENQILETQDGLKFDLEATGKELAILRDEREEAVRLA